jgi:hypothetical protein
MLENKYQHNVEKSETDDNIDEKAKIKLALPSRIKTEHETTCYTPNNSSVVGR